MTILRRVTQSSRLTVVRHLLNTNKSPTLLTRSFSTVNYNNTDTAIHNTNSLTKATGTSIGRVVLSKQQKRYVNIPSSRGSEGVLGGSSMPDEEFNEDDYFKSTDMELGDDITSSSLSLDSSYDEPIKTKTEREKEEEREFERRQAIRDELDTRKGRLWEDPWEITDEDWSSGKTLDDLPDWNENLCSRISKERVKVHPDGVPTLDQLATLQHEAAANPHPALGSPQPYLKQRKRTIYNTIYDAVVSHAEAKVHKILSMEKWDEKQNAIDDLFEEIHDQVRYHSSLSKLKGKNGQKTKNTSSLSGKSEEEYKEYMSVVLGSQPNFPKLVQSALENYLKSVVKEEKAKLDSTVTSTESSNDDEQLSTTTTNDPIFMDILKAPDSSLDDVDVPKLLAPIKPHGKDGPGRMLEEWELSAKRDTKRILIRECITDIAKSMVETHGPDSEKGSRIFVSGRQGVGKTAALAALVASARTSGHIVLYIPDGRRLTHLGYYLEPNPKSRADGDLLFDLPILTNEMCAQFLECHEKDLDGMVVTSDTVKKFLSPDQLRKSKDLPKPNDDGVYSLVELLKVGSESVTVGAGCYQAAIHTLMNQSDKPFTVVMDEFNCYFGYGHYFHAKYDDDVENSIPLNKFTLFKQFMDAVGVEKHDDGSIVAKDASPMKRGSIIVGTSESHAIKRSYTKNLEEAVVSAGCKFVTVPQYSPLEVEHILANFEIIGIGRLRFDRGATVMNNQEVTFLRMVSGGVGQRLLDACVC